MVAEAKTREQREAEWWKEWWDADYSWNGLANPAKNIRGDGGLHGERSRQDYWRRDPVTGEPRDEATLAALGELEKRGDEYWHIAHIPLHWPDGTPAKADWDTAKQQKLAALIAARVKAATETTVNAKIFEEEKVSGPDGRAQLQGCVLLDPPVHPDGTDAALHLAAWRCWLPAWDAANLSFGPGANFDSATFTGDANFFSATFTGYARFDSATFTRAASFGRATFTGDARFYSATFTGDAHFYSTTFTRDARFGSATFTRDARFDSATFTRDANFESATFTRDASFFSATFTRDASFFCAIFTGDARFDDATFTRDANFGSATFTRDASFESATFKKVAGFKASLFETVGEDGERKSGTMAFRQSLFEGPALFTHAVFAANPAHHSAAFLGARFKDLANFRRCGDRWIAALDEAEIEKRLLIDDPDEASANSTFADTMLPGAVAGGTNRATREPFLKELEGGCRTVKVAMARAKDAVMEQRYYRFELIARRHQAGTPRAERWLSAAYGMISDYGLSLWRPLLTLGLTILYFAGLFGIIHAATLGTNLSAGQSFDALAMSASRVFPFGAFDLVSNGWLRDILGLEPNEIPKGGTALLVRFIATLESLVALILVFLFGLAVRRRFQIG